MGGPRARIKKLEQGSGGECPRCKGSIGVFRGGELHHASRHGEAMAAEEWASAFPDDACLLCGETPVKIVVVEEGEA